MKRLPLFLVFMFSLLLFSCNGKVQKTQPVSVQISLDTTQLELAVGATVTLVATSSDPSMPITWVSSDEAVAMVGATGLVRAIAEGEANITASVHPSVTDVVSATATVKVTKPAADEEKPADDTTAVAAKKQPEPTTINFGYAVYEAQPGVTGVKNGKPHGNGVMIFKQSHVIPGTQDCIAAPGEWVIGMWREGKINAGTWHRNNGEEVVITLGQRYSE